MKTLVVTLLFPAAPFNTFAQTIAALAAPLNAKTLVNAAMRRVPQLDTTGLQAQPQTVVIDVRNQTS